jgi:hypothetical protein
METPRRTKKRKINLAVCEALQRIRSSNKNELSAIVPNNELAPLLNYGDPELEQNQLDDIEPPELGFENEVEQNDDIGREVQLSSQIRTWALQYNITHVAINGLLKILRRKYPYESLPLDARTILRTSRKVNIVRSCGGSSYYFGLSSQITKIVEKGVYNFRCHNLPFPFEDSSTLTLKIGIDGLPISRSSNIQFWPILGSVDQAKVPSLFLISLFYGDSKPDSANNFLSNFVEEMKLLEHEGLIISGKHYIFRIRVIIADAPARAFIKSIKNHNAYFGCERCNRRGKWAKRVIYTKNSLGTLYSDESFRDQVYSEHHEGISILTELKIDMISQIPLDYMHLVCLGTMKKMLLLWTSGPLSSRLGPRDILKISRRLISCKLQFPNDFNRKCRSLKDLKHWKATEYRTFLLYLGPVVLRGVLSNEKYEHFLLFHLGIYILVSESAFESVWVEYAGKLLNRFVDRIPELYFRELLVYNMHSLRHLHLDANIHGPLDRFSAFEFENGMQYLKRLIRTKSSHLSQVVKRISELGCVPLSNHVEISLSENGKLSEKSTNNCYLTKGGRIVIVTDCSNNPVKCRAFKNLGDAENYPCPSSKMSIFVASNLRKRVVLIEKKDFLKKCFLISMNDINFCIPLCSSKIQ